MAFLRWILIVCWVIAQFPVRSDAYFRYFSDDSKYFGTTTLSFLRLPIGGRALSMGGRSVATDQQASAMYWNPGALAFIPDYWTTFSHAEILGVFRQEYLSAVLPLKSLGSWGVSANVLGGTIEGRDFNENSIRPIHIDLALGGGAGWQIIPNRLGLGFRIDGIHSQIADVTAHGYSINLGGIYIPKRDYRLGFAWHHLAHGITYNTRTMMLERLPQTLLLEVGKVPGISGFGWSLGLSNTIEGNHYYYGGLEYFLTPNFILRGGYEYTSNEMELNGLAGLSFGTGISYQQFALDWGLKIMAPLGYHTNISLSYQIRGRSPLTETDWVIRAKEKFREDKLEQSEMYVREALKINPQYWDAVSLLARIQQEKERRSGNVVSLFYTSNIQGAFAPVLWQGQYLGGVARLKTLIDRLKKDTPNYLLLDAGNRLPLGIDPNLGNLLERALGTMGFDAVGASLHQFEKVPEGLARTQAAYHGLPQVISNVQMAEGFKSNARVKKIKTTKGFDFAIISLVEKSWVPDSLTRIHQMNEVLSEIAVLRKELSSSKYIQILLYYGTLGSAQQILYKYPEIQILLLAGETQALPQPFVMGNTLILNTGSQGTHLGQLVLRFGKERQLESYLNTLIPISLDIPPHPEIAALIEPAILNVDREVHQLATPNLKNMEDFVFVRSNTSERMGKIILKMGSERGFQNFITPSENCFQPVYSAINRRVSYQCIDAGSYTLYTQNIQSPRAVKIANSSQPFGRVLWDEKQQWLYYVLKNQATGKLYRTLALGNGTQEVFAGQWDNIQGFDYHQKSEMWAVQRSLRESSELWITDKNGQTLLKVSDTEEYPERPLWSQDGNYLAYISSKKGSKRNRLYIFSLRDKEKILVSDQNSIGDIQWSKSKNTLYFSAGVNLHDLNFYDLSTRKQEKLLSNSNQFLESSDKRELSPLKVFGQQGFLFESTQDTTSRILWISETGDKETPIVTSPGFNYLR